MSENIYNLVPREYVAPVKEPMHRSSFDPKASLSGSTFGKSNPEPQNDFLSWVQVALEQPSFMVQVKLYGRMVLCMVLPSLILVCLWHPKRRWMLRLPVLVLESLATQIEERAPSLRRTTSPFWELLIPKTISLPMQLRPFCKVSISLFTWTVMLTLFDSSQTSQGWRD